jgi:hypothetical protein
VSAALLVTIVRFASSQLSQALKEYARVVHLAPGLLPAGLGLLPSQQAEVAEEFRALLQAGAAVAEDGPAPNPQGLTEREVESKASS